MDKHYLIVKIKSSWLYSVHILCFTDTLDLVVYNQWTGLLDWNTGLDYWTDIFLVFTHF